MDDLDIFFKWIILLGRFQITDSWNFQGKERVLEMEKKLIRNLKEGDMESLKNEGAGHWPLGH